MLTEVVTEVVMEEEGLKPWLNRLGDQLIFSKRTLLVYNRGDCYRLNL
jgi:hypothetical protein